MTRRILINENIELREIIREENGARIRYFGIFSTDKNEFLQQGGKPIIIDETLGYDALVLPANHKLSKLDLTLKTADGQPSGARANIIHMLLVENHGAPVEVMSPNVAVSGRATIRATPYDAAGIHTGALFLSRDVKPQGADAHRLIFPIVTSSYAIQDSPGGFEAPRFRYGEDQSLTPLADGRVDFIHPQTGHPVLTIDGGENKRAEHAIEKEALAQTRHFLGPRGRFSMRREEKKGPAEQTVIGMYPTMSGRVYTLLKSTGKTIIDAAAMDEDSPETRSKKVAALNEAGVPEWARPSLPARIQPPPINPYVEQNLSAVKEESAQDDAKRKALLEQRNEQPIIVPDGRKAQLMEKALDEALAWAKGTGIILAPEASPADSAMPAPPMRRGTTPSR